MRFKEEGEGGVHLEEEGERFFFTKHPRVWSSREGDGARTRFNGNLDYLMASYLVCLASLK